MSGHEAYYLKNVKTYFLQITVAHRSSQRGQNHTITDGGLDVLAIAPLNWPSTEMRKWGQQSVGPGPGIYGEFGPGIYGEVGLGGLGVTYSPRDPRFAFQIRLRSMDFSERKNPEHKSSGRDFKLGLPSLRFQAR